ncbi:MAG: LysR family transcriptional regulator [Mogibacterium sp.]|nr:LysR family transcriptional regulator [Mogibacterium sp.]MBQ6315199.1 LysR family transcriptional regulator [Mogibacterium sp.]
MTNGENAFMALAEELNFTRAAEKIYMSQQGLSDHIKRLEKEYDTVLVARKPEVALTASGQELYNMLRAKQAMERDIHRMIAGIDNGDVGEVNIGIPTSRARVFTSDIVEKYHKEHPHVRIRIVSELTFILQEMLEEGDLDFIIGVDPMPQKDMRVEYVFDDPVYMAIPEDIARERSGSASSTDIRLYQDLPFVRDLHESSTGNMIDAFLAQNKIFLNNIISINDHNEQAALCKRLGAAMFCSKSFAFFDGGDIMRKGLRVMGIEGLNESVKVCLVMSEKRVYPKCVEDFIEVTRESLHRFADRHI